MRAHPNILATIRASPVPGDAHRDRGNRCSRRVGAQPLIAADAVQSENLLVERAGAFELLDIERRFENAEQAGHVTYSLCATTG